jgi:prophage antirepressor-like protein
MNSLITIQNVRGYIDHNGTAYLNLEDVSRGLGFTQEKDGKVYVRWETVYRYLEEFNYKYPLDSSQLVGKANFIPENIFYRLAMKAKNETAEKFQAFVADEVLPQLRKTGTYSIQKPQCIEDLIILQAQSMKELRAEVNQLQSTQRAIKEAVIAEPDNWREDINRKMNKIAEAIGLNKYREVRSESYRLLEQRAGVLLERRLLNKRARMLAEGMSKTAIDKTNKMDIIDEDKKLREIYAKIVSEYYIKYVA